MIVALLSIKRNNIEFEAVFEENMVFLKSITVLVYEVLILSFKFNKFTRKIDIVVFG